MKRLKTNANRAKKTSSQNTLKYTSLFENGLMNIVDDNYSMTYELGSTNYATATIETKQTIFEKYNSMINTISDEEHFQLTILVSKVHSKEYQQKNEFELQGDDYDYLREELNHLIHENYKNGYNNYQIDRYITISTKAENKKKALSKLKNTETLLASSL
ncbi:VirB4-like conjugal transfer ATPase, CD1110 family, partial [Lactococcus lactis]